MLRGGKTCIARPAGEMFDTAPRRVTCYPVPFGAPTGESGREAEHLAGVI